MQIYRCTHAEQGERWVLEAPETTLYDTANLPVGSHGAGPVWTWKDGSSVKGSVVKKEASPANSIPWLLLSAVPVLHPTGFLSNVRWVRRSDTEGGLVPETGCDAGHEQFTARVPYSAQYTFYTDASLP